MIDCVREATIGVAAIYCSRQQVLPGAAVWASKSPTGPATPRKRRAPVVADSWYHKNDPIFDLPSHPSHLDPRILTLGGHWDCQSVMNVKYINNFINCECMTCYVNIVAIPQFVYVHQ